MRRAYRQRSLIEVLLSDADKLWDPTLRRIDALLDDEGLVDRVAEASGRSSCRGSHARSARAWANRAPPGAAARDTSHGAAISAGAPSGRRGGRGLFTPA